jgi:hypothetical protein
MNAQDVYHIGYMQGSQSTINEGMELTLLAEKVVFK